MIAIQGELNPGNNSRSVREEIAARAAKEESKTKPVAPLEAPVLAFPHPPIYKMHRYYARRPYNVFAKIIEHYTASGDIILDPFCGGGVTVVEGLKLRRRVIGVDLNPLATWITKVEVEPADIQALQTAFQRWSEWMQKEITPLYAAQCGKCRRLGIAEWFEWSKVVACPECRKPVVLGKAKKLRGGMYQCLTCKAPLLADKCTRKSDELLAVFVNCPHCETSKIRESLPSDFQLVERITKSFSRIVKKEKLKIPDDPFPNGNSVWENNLFAKGFYYFRDYFTQRNLIANARLKKWLLINLDPGAIRDALMHVFSASLRFTNKMVIRSEAWRGDKPLEWAGHIYWPAYTYLEANPINPLRNRFTALVAGKKEQTKFIGKFCRFPKSRRPFEELKNGATCWLLTQSSHKLPIPDASVDAIITDPPFGGNVQYAELSDFYLVWLKEHLGLSGIMDTRFEAIETRHHDFDGAKGREFYEKMLFQIFKECRRVLKPNGWLVLTFHNRDVGVWMAMNRAAIRAGFRLPPPEISRNRGMVYQPPIENYTQTIHQKRAGSMLGDFILSFQPIEAPFELEAIQEALSATEERELLEMAREIIVFHGGADETTLMTGLLPYLSEKGLLSRLARFDIRPLFNGHFVYVKTEKKWFTRDMVDEEQKPIRVLDHVPAVHHTQVLVHDYLQQRKRATVDELLIEIYTKLVNSHRPQMEAIDGVLSRFCRKVKVKGEKRELYEWKPGAQTLLEKQQALIRQTSLFDGVTLGGHDDIIRFLIKVATERGLLVHVGVTEQKKNPDFRAISLKLTGFELGLSPAVFRILKEIDLLILKDHTVQTAVEVVISLGTLPAAIDRFVNLFTVAPNLRITAAIVSRAEDIKQIRRSLTTPAHRKMNLAEKIQVIPGSHLSSSHIQNRLLPEVSVEQP